MFSVLYQTIFVGVHSAGYSLAYAAPMAAFSAAAAAAYFRFAPPPAFLFGFAVAALLLLALFIIAALEAMLHPEAPPSFADSLRFRRRHVDFLAFSAATFIVLGILIFVLIYIVGALYANIEEMEKLRSEAAGEDESPGKYGYGAGGALIFLFGTRLFTVLAFFSAVALWSMFFRIFIKMPAYVDGFELSSGEALDLTAAYRRQILIISVILNAAFFAIIGALPWQESEPWVRLLMGGCALWAGVHFNLAYSVAAYWQYTEGYQMRPVRY